MTLKEIRQGIYLDDDILDDILDGITKCDGIIFDCDGVLIDISESYDLAIRNTAKHILEEYGIKNPILVDSHIIDGFKSTGGFNDEVDLTYGVILAIVAADKLGYDQKSFISEVISNLDYTGIKSAEKYIEGIVDVHDIRERLCYPGPHAENVLYRIFDQMFYGEKLYSQVYGIESEFPGPGLIENDKLIINDILLDALHERFSNVGIVTGRGMISARHSLGKLLDRFDLKNSAFLEDEPRNLAKPNPESLVCAVRGMNSKCCMYVGDSIEDYIMAQKSTELGSDIIFCGITGTSRNPKEKLALFERNGVKIILDSIKLLPEIL